MLINGLLPGVTASSKNVLNSVAIESVTVTTNSHLGGHIMAQEVQTKTPTQQKHSEVSYWHAEQMATPVADIGTRFVDGFKRYGLHQC